MANVGRHDIYDRLDKLLWSAGMHLRLYDFGIGQAVMPAYDASGGILTAVVIGVIDQQKRIVLIQIGYMDQMALNVGNFAEAIMRKFNAMATPMNPEMVTFPKPVSYEEIMK